MRERAEHFVKSALRKHCSLPPYHAIDSWDSRSVHLAILSTTVATSHYRRPGSSSLTLATFTVSETNATANTAQATRARVLKKAPCANSKSDVKQLHVVPPRVKLQSDAVSATFSMSGDADYLQYRHTWYEPSPPSFLAAAMPPMTAPEGRMK